MTWFHGFTRPETFPGIEVAAPEAGKIIGNMRFFSHVLEPIVRQTMTNPSICCLSMNCFISKYWIICNPSIFGEDYDCLFWGWLHYIQGGFTSLQPNCIQLACEVCRKQSQACRNECLRRGPIPFASICIHLHGVTQPGGFKTEVEEPEEPAEAIFHPICFAIHSGDIRRQFLWHFWDVYCLWFYFPFSRRPGKTIPGNPASRTRAGVRIGKMKAGHSDMHLGLMVLNKWTNPEDSGRCTFCRFTMIYRDLPRFMLFPFW